MKRRDFLRTGLLGAGGLAGIRPGRARAGDAEQPGPDGRALARRLPRWRGFNLLEMFVRGWHNGPFSPARLRVDPPVGVRLRPPADGLPSLDRRGRSLQAR